jgi:dihydrodipicolinate synthase/N-acetylneuraminate lyase
VIAGCGSNDTNNAILHLNFSKKSGAAAGLVVAPYYNRPNQEGIYAHFEAMTKKNDLPIVLYNVPARTVTDIKPEMRLAREEVFGPFIAVVGYDSIDEAVELANDTELGPDRKGAISKSKTEVQKGMAEAVAEAVTEAASGKVWVASDFGVLV